MCLRHFTITVKSVHWSEVEAKKNKKMRKTNLHHIKIKYKKWKEKKKIQQLKIEIQQT